MWVSSVDSDAVQRIDPATDEAQAPITTEALPDGLLDHAGSLWVATDLGPILQRIDPAAAEITGTWVVSDQGRSPPTSSSWRPEGRSGSRSSTGRKC